MSSVLTRPFTRRQFMTAGAIGAVGTLTAGAWSVGIYRSAFFDKLQVTDYHFATPKWPADLPSLKIAFLTDLHVGCLSVDLDHVGKIVEQVNALNADIILLGGDYLTNKPKKFYRSYIEPRVIAEKLQPLHAKLGVYSVLGNHDWANSGKEMWNDLEDVGIKVL